MITSHSLSISRSHTTTQWLKSQVIRSCGSARSIGVPNMPGAMASTRTPNWANSRAAGSVSAATPPLDDA